MVQVVDQTADLLTSELTNVRDVIVDGELAIVVVVVLLLGFASILISFSGLNLAIQLEK